MLTHATVPYAKGEQKDLHRLSYHSSWSWPSARYRLLVTSHLQLRGNIFVVLASCQWTVRWSLQTQTVYNTHPFNGPFPGLPRSAGTRKVKPVWILLKQETVSGISWAICKSAHHSRQITTPAPHHSVFTARCYACAVLAMGLCLSVSICLSQVGVLLKRLNTGSHKQNHTTAQGL